MMYANYNQVAYLPDRSFIIYCNFRPDYIHILKLWSRDKTDLWMGAKPEVKGLVTSEVILYSLAIPESQSIPFDKFKK